MRDSRDSFRLVRAAMEQQPVVSCGSESIATEKVLTTESVVFLDRGQHGGTCQICEAHAGL
jgi:hypothetical protein